MLLLWKYEYPADNCSQNIPVVLSLPLETMIPNAATKNTIWITVVTVAVVNVIIIIINNITETI